MAIYCTGDVQGCDEALQRLLEQVDFSPSRDTVYLLGDLVNRGPASVQVLRRCWAADGAILSLLGNHDLHPWPTGRASPRCATPWPQCYKRLTAWRCSICCASNRWRAR